MLNSPMDYELPLKSFKPRKWPVIFPSLHVKIKKLYQSKAGHSGDVARFADRHGLPRWKITRYAQEKGWVVKQKKEPDWSDAELGILKRSAHHCPSVIQRHLKRAGYHRSTVGIVLKRKRMRYLNNFTGGGQSARSLALCLGEDIHFITRAIKAGQIKAARRQQNRTPQQGGNTYLIKDKSARDFIINHLHMIDLRKVDKYWFVDLISREID